jgi:hypothetical protein
MSALSAPPTFTDGVLVTATDLSNLRTNVDTLAQNTLGRTLASGASTKPMCYLTSNAHNFATGSITSTPNTITWDNEVLDTDSMATAGGTTVTIQTAGWYEICLHVGFVSGSSGIRCAAIMVNGTSNPGNIAAMGDEVMAASGHVYVEAHLYERFTAGTVIRGGALQNTGASLSSDTALGGTWMVVAWDAPYS